MTENTYEYKSPSGRTARLILSDADVSTSQKLYIYNADGVSGEYFSPVVPVTEPLGLGAVLLDEHEVIWVRAEPIDSQDKRVWVNKKTDYVVWSRITNPTVLSEGYTA